MKNPILYFIDIRKGERLFTFLMFCYFFLVITIFWILKPLKKAAFVGFYDQDGMVFLSMVFKASQAELLAKVANMLVAIVAVTVFSWLSKKFHRQQLTIIFSLFFLCCYSILSLYLTNQTPFLVWSFYLFGDLFNTIMVATFFAFLNDSVNSETAKRLYGMIGLGGVLGGAFGSIMVRSLIKSEGIDMNSWMNICFGMTVLIALFAIAASRRLEHLHHYHPNPSKIPTSEPIKANSAIAGAKLTMRSSYLFSIVAIVGLYEIASTLIDFQFTETILHYVAKDELGNAFSTAYMYMNITAVVVQLFFTSFVMRRLGMRTALMVLPLAILIISTGYLLFPILIVGMLLPSADGGFAYSLNQSAKETLYVPTTREEKYKAKAFIDMFVQRFAKVLAIGVSLGITALFTDFSTFRWLSLATIGVIIIWLFAVRFAGMRFSTISKRESAV